MRLVRIRRRVWDVLAVSEPWGGDVWPGIEVAAKGDPGAEDMLATLETEVPLNGPPLRNKSKCRPLGDGIFEFKAPGLRVLWFYDIGEPKARRRIVCTHSSPKMSKKEFQKEIAKAKRFRQQYVAAKVGKTLEVPEGDDD